MPTTRECDFCGDDIEPGTGTMFVAVNGTVTHFCSSKCEKNADLGRESRDHEWTVAGQAVAPEAHGQVSEAMESEAKAKDEAETMAPTPDLETIEEDAGESDDLSTGVDAPEEPDAEGTEGDTEPVEEPAEPRTDPESTGSDVEGEPIEGEPAETGEDSVDGAEQPEAVEEEPNGKAAESEDEDDTTETTEE